MNPSTTQARVVVDELIRGGVRDVVLCPGSRNAPLAFALADADRAGRIRLHVRIDERTAGYLAIGLVIAAGAPVCVAMTSGTAVANLGPAVVEANYARVPLIVLSANRPYELLGTGANQTMEQLGYFGTQVRAAISLGLAEDAPERLDALNARVLAAATGSRTANAGPVQFDIPLREPLVPDPEPHGAPTPGRPWTYTPPVSFDQPLDIDLSPDTVVIAGHGAGTHPNLAQLPTVAEPTAPAPDNPLHPLALRLLRPKQVIMLGRPTLHRPVSALLADPQVPVYALTTGPRWPDVSGNSQATGTRAVTTPISGLAAPLRTGQPARRDAALVGLYSHHIRVRSNRGVAGIDGTVSTAIGAALRGGARRAHRRADRRPDVRARQLRAADRADRAHPTPADDRGVQRQRRRHLRAARAGRPAVLRRVVAGLRHSARRRRGGAVPGVSRRERPDRGRRIGRRPRRTRARDAGAGGQGRPLVAAATARRHQGGAVTISPKALLHILIHGRSDPPETTRGRIALRWARIAVLIVTGLVTLQSVLLVAGAWRNDLAITHNMGVAQAEVLSAGPRRSTIEFVTPERVTYRPELGVLYPSHLATGMRIYVEYNKNDPNLVRVQHRNAGLAIIPAGSIAVVGWLGAAVLLALLALADKWLDRRGKGAGPADFA